MFEKIELGPYLEDICKSFSESLPECLLHVSIKAGIEVPPDQAIPVALFVNELITNSAKYGHPDSKCKVWIDVVRTDSKISVSVRDKGKGLPPNFESTSRKGLGMRLINAFAEQLAGKLEIRRHDPGVEFIVTFDGLSQPLYQKWLLQHGPVAKFFRFSATGFDSVTPTLISRMAIPIGCLGKFQCISRDGVSRSNRAARPATNAAMSQRSLLPCSILPKPGHSACTNVNAAIGCGLA